MRIQYQNGLRTIVEAQTLTPPFALIRKVANVRGRTQRTILPNGFRLVIPPAKSR